MLNLTSISSFTSHYVSINSIIIEQKSKTYWIFTSHYVSINSQEQRQTVRDGIYLHPTMYLLIQFHKPQQDQHQLNLHPTMYLLILIRITANHYPFTFTSHYVSINSRLTSYRIRHLHTHLHPTMYLLIPYYNLNHQLSF